MVIEPFNYQKRTNIEEHNQIVDKLNEVVDAVNNINPEPSEFEQRIDALEQSAINQQNAIDGIHTRDALQDTAIQRAEDNVSALETDVSEIGTRIATVESQNLQQDSAIATLGQRVGATEDNVTGLTGRVGQLETDTTNLDGRVTDIDGRLTTLSGNYTALGGRVDSINTEVGQLSTEVGGLETGKVNIVQGSENAGKYMVVDNDGNVTPQTLDKDFKVDYTMNFMISSTEAFGDNLFAGVMDTQMTLPTAYNYIINVVFNDGDSDIDWYATSEQGYFNIIFDRQPTQTVWVFVYGVVIG